MLKIFSDDTFVTLPVDNRSQCPMGKNQDSGFS